MNVKILVIEHLILMYIAFVITDHGNILVVNQFEKDKRNSSTTALSVTPFIGMYTKVMTLSNAASYTTYYGIAVSYTHLELKAVPWIEHGNTKENIKQNNFRIHSIKRRTKTPKTTWIWITHQHIKPKNECFSYTFFYL